jgi:hypothetical protein
MLRSVSMEYPKSQKGYAPVSVLTDLLVHINNFEEKKAKLEKRIHVGRTMKKRAFEEKKALKKEKRLLDRRKVDILNNHLFRSMANLTVFLEYIMNNPYLQNTFEKDLKALFFAKSTLNSNPRGTESVFARFIEACCWSKTSKTIMPPLSKKGETKMPLSDFRFVLMETMMDKIWKMIPEIGQNKFKNDTFLNNVLYADFGRAVSWMKEFVHEPHGHLQFDEKRRPALF